MLLSLDDGEETDVYVFDPNEKNSMTMAKKRRQLFIYTMSSLLFVDIKRPRRHYHNQVNAYYLSQDNSKVVDQLPDLVDLSRNMQSMSFNTYSYHNNRVNKSEFST